jgi:hypothetical protein
VRHLGFKVRNSLDSPINVRPEKHQECVDLIGQALSPTDVRVALPARLRAAGLGRIGNSGSRSFSLGPSAVIGRQPASRTRRLSAHQADPFTGWVAARGCGRSRTCKAVKLAGFQSRFRQPIGLRILSGEGEARTHKAVKLAGFRIRCRRPTLGLPLHGRAPPDLRINRSHLRAKAALAADGAGLEPAHGLRRGLRFPAGHLANSVSHPPAESGAFEAHARGRALVSSEARALPVHSPRCPTPDSNRDLFLLREAPLPVGLEGHWSGRRGSNPRPQRWQRCALPAALRPHGARWRD